MVNEYNFDKEVKDYLMQKGYVRRRQLIEYLIKKHENTRGYSLKNINRKLDNLTKQGIIVRLKYADFKKLGIKDTDERASYLTLKDISKIKKHMDNVFERLSLEEPIKQKIALKEIARYEQTYVLTPEQLDLVVTQFDKGIGKDNIDNELANTLLLLLNISILKKGIEPTNNKKTISLLVKLLDKYPDPSATNVSIKTHIIHLLGHYNHKAVIEQFIKDAKILQSPFSVESVYNTEYTANLIEEHREELYELEEELAIEGRDKASQFVSNIRGNALEILGLRKSSKGNEKVDF